MNLHPSSYQLWSPSLHMMLPPPCFTKETMSLFCFGGFFPQLDLCGAAAVLIVFAFSPKTQFILILNYKLCMTLTFFKKKRSKLCVFFDSASSFLNYFLLIFFNRIYSKQSFQFLCEKWGGGKVCAFLSKYWESLDSMQNEILQNGNFTERIFKKKKKRCFVFNLVNLTSQYNPNHQCSCWR